MPPSANHTPALLWVLLALIFAMANSTAPAPLYRLFQTQWGFSATTLTVIYSVYAGGVLITLLVFGRLSDKLTDRRYLIIPSLVTVFIGAIWIAASNSVEGLIIGRLLSGMGTGALTGSASAALVELVAPGARKRAAMLTTTSITAGGALGPAISAAALWIPLDPTRLPFIITALGSLASIVGLLRAAWPKRTAEIRPRDAVASGDVDRIDVDDVTGAADHADGTADTARATPEPGLLASCGNPFVIASAALAVGWAAGAFAMNLAPTLAENLMGIHDRATIAMLLCIFQLFTGASQLLSRDLPPRTALFAGTALVGIAMPACAIAAWLGLIGLFAVATLAIGVGYGASFVGAAGIVNETAPSHRRAGVVSLFYVVGYGGTAAPILAFGAAADWLGMLPATGIFAVACVGIVIVILKQSTRLPAF